MTQTPLPTRFLPAERATDDDIRRQHQAIASLPFVGGCLDAMPNMVLMLNEHRQIVFANATTLETLGVGLDGLLGTRPGEALGCIHASEECDCGISEFCTTCGAALAVSGALAGAPDARECRIQAESPKPDLDLKVWATPFAHEGSSFTVFAVVDTSHEKRRRILERIFFHDVLNTAGGVKGLAGLIADSAPEDIPELARLLDLSSDRLVDEILSHRDLAAIESGEFRARPIKCSLRTFLNTMARLCATLEAARGRTIVVEPGAPADSIVTDRALLMRVLGNMIKNALEAEAEGAVIRLGVDRVEGGRWALWVRNPAVIPRAVQLQVFQRSFSTKGEGRGLGTYSTRLLTERFLEGKASFTSTEEAGTEFRITIPAAIQVGHPED